MNGLEFVVCNTIYLFLCNDCCSSGFRNMQMNPSQESLTCLFCHLHVYLQSDAFFVLYGLELIMLGHDHHKDGNGITAVRYYSKA